MDASMAYACAATIGEFGTAHLEPILVKALSRILCSNPKGL